MMGAAWWSIESRGLELRETRWLNVGDVNKGDKALGERTGGEVAVSES